MFRGIFTALVTPLKNNAVDVVTLGRLIDRQLQANVNGLVLCGTTGEGALLTDGERRLVLDTAVKRVQGRVPVIMGCSAMSTWAAIENARNAKALGVDGILVAVPPYVRPTEDGIFTHFATIADHVSLPIVIYNAPSRSVCDVSVATLTRLATHENIVAVKEAAGSVERMQQIIASAGNKLNVLSGDDTLTLSCLVAGGHGVVSTSSNVVPDKWITLWRHWTDGDVGSASAVQAGLLGLHEALLLESNPGPLKAALNLLGLCEPEIRLPLMWPARPIIFRIAAELEHLGIQIQSGALV